MSNRMVKLLELLWKMGYIPFPKDFSEEEIKKALQMVVQLAEWLAGKTQTTVDDVWVAKIKALIDDPELFHSFYVVVKWLIEQCQPTIYGDTMMNQELVAQAKVAIGPEMLALAKEVVGQLPK